MSATASDLAKEARLYRQSGHCAQSARLLRIARSKYPAEECLAREEKKLQAANKRSYSRCLAAMTWFVDLVGLPLFFFLMAIVAWLLGPIFFVESL